MRAVAEPTPPSSGSSRHRSTAALRQPPPALPPPRPAPGRRLPPRPVLLCRRRRHQQQHAAAADCRRRRRHPSGAGFHPGRRAGPGRVQMPGRRQPERARAGALAGVSMQHCCFLFVVCCFLFLVFLVSSSCCAPLNANPLPFVEKYSVLLGLIRHQATRLTGVLVTLTKDTSHWRVRRSSTHSGCGQTKERVVFCCCCSTAPQVRVKHAY